MATKNKSHPKFENRYDREKNKNSVDCSWKYQLFCGCKHAMWFEKWVCDSRLLWANSSFVSEIGPKLYHNIFFYSFVLMIQRW